MRKLLLAICFTISTLSFATPVELSAFYQMPAVEQPTLSPDGKNIAVILNQGESTMVAIAPFDNPTDLLPIVKLGAKKIRIDEITWGNNNRVLVSVSQPLTIHSIKVRTTHLYSVQTDGKDLLELKIKIKDRSAWADYRKSMQLVSLLPNDKNHVLVSIRTEADGLYSSLYKININDGDYDKYLANPLRIHSWGVALSGEVLMGIGEAKSELDDSEHLYVRKDKDADWKKVKSFEAFKTDTFLPIAFDEVNNVITVLSDRKLGKTALWNYHVDSDKYELLGEAPENYDVVSAIVRNVDNKRKVVGFRYIDNFVQRVFFDNETNGTYAQLRPVFENIGLKSTLYDSSENKNRHIVHAISDNSPGKFFLFDRDKRKVTPWFGQYPALEGKALAKVREFTFKARDNMSLRGYLTLPNGVENPPVVLFPHGGPFARDTQYFDPFVQMFASRGYAVLQVNFRGSTGFGNAYQTAGYLQWGKKMQTDLIDAMSWLTSQKVANTNKACVVGFSYGGYAALAAGYQTPEMFKCLVSGAGVADMNAQASQWRKYGYNNYLETAVSADSAFLSSISPVNHVKAFTAPVLLIHGKSDVRVHYNQSEKMHKALQNAKKQSELVLFKFGTHNFDDAANRQIAMETISSFLDKHLK